MGLFSDLFGIGDAAEEFCPVCSAKLPSALMPFNGTKKLADGRICSRCAAQISPFVTGIKHMTVSQMAAHLQYRNENYQALQLFTETHRIQEGGITIALDWNRQQILFSSVADYRSANADVLSLPQITSVQYEINESRRTETRDLKDDYGPRQMPVYSYAFHFIISVNHPWFSTIQFLVNNRTSVDLTNQEVLLDCVSDGDNIYRFLSSIGFPSKFTDNTTCGIDSLRNGTALNKLIPPPPLPQPDAQARDAMVMGAAAGNVMEQPPKKPRKQPAPKPEEPKPPRTAPAHEPAPVKSEPPKEEKRPASRKRKPAEEAHEPMGQAPMQRPAAEPEQKKPRSTGRKAQETQPEMGPQGMQHPQGSQGRMDRQPSAQYPQGTQTGRPTQAGMNAGAQAERTSTARRNAKDEVTVSKASKQEKKDSSSAAKPSSRKTGTTQQPQEAPSSGRRTGKSSGSTASKPQEQARNTRQDGPMGGPNQPGGPMGGRGPGRR